MIKIDYTQPGGFPLEQPVLDKMQRSYYDALRAFIGYLKIPDVGNYVIHGCDIVGPDITPGMLWIDGDLCTFAGVVGTDATKIKKAIVTTTAEFENGSTLAVFTETIAQVDAAGTALSAFIRFYPVYDQNYVHTDFNFTAALLTKLNGIEALAQKNVQTDWNVINPLSDAYFKNRPKIAEILKMSSVLIGDVGTSDLNPDTTITAYFESVGTADYQVVPTLMAQGSGNANNDVSYCILLKTHNSFTISLKGYSSDIQNLMLEYTLLKFVP